MDECNYVTGCFPTERDICADCQKGHDGCLIYPQIVQMEYEKKRQMI
jgi:hypothetical protein